MKIEGRGGGYRRPGASAGSRGVCPGGCTNRHERERERERKREREKERERERKRERERQTHT